MRILELRFKNLNSLYGEWSINFNAPEYISDGIFAITGKTGAGKSTILDAICLALYGRTPRLKSISKNDNEIMSRRTNECYAEVLFETQSGVFRCHWSQHRAHGSVDGNLVEAKHEIAEGISHKILESKRRDVTRVVIEKTGMDFERFTRSMLLAQGNFAAFLQASPDERSPILEQITGTEIYSEISKRVHERNREERNTLEILQAETEGITVLSEQQNAELQTELTRKQHMQQEISAQHENIHQSIQLQKTIDDLYREIENISEEEAIILEEMTSFKPDEERLERAKKAMDIEGVYAQWDSQREQQKSDGIVLENDKEKLSLLTHECTQLEDAVNQAVNATSCAKHEQATELDLIKHVRPMDLRITEKKAMLETTEHNYHTKEQERATHQEQQATCIDNQNKNVQALEQIDVYLLSHAHDEALVAGLAGIAEQAKNIQSLTKDIDAKKDLIAQQEQQVKEHIQRYETQASNIAIDKEKYEHAQTQRNEANNTLSKHLDGRLLREYRTERDTLMKEMAYIKKISDLESERKQLQDGIPCPLCGALEHPFADDNVQEVDKTEQHIDKLTIFIEQAEQMEQCIKNHEANVATTQSKVTESESTLYQTEHKKDEAERTFVRLNNELQKMLEDLTKRRNTLYSHVQPFGITESELSEHSIPSMLLSLEERHTQWLEHQQKKEILQKHRSDFEADIKRLDGIIGTMTKSLQEQEEIIDTLKKESHQLDSKRKELYATKNPDEEEKRLKTLVDHTKQIEDKARENYDTVQKQMADVQTRITAYQDAIMNRQPALEILEKDVMEHLHKNGFVDEQDFILGRLSVDERNTLENKSKNLYEKQSHIQARKKEIEIRLVKENDKKTTDVSLTILEKEYQDIKVSVQKIAEEIGAIHQSLADNEHAKAKYHEKQTLITKQQKECERWNALHKLIGSMDGKKYRNFAQGLTFEVMVSHANKQLEKMTDRYLLVRDNDSLELNVIDIYQAGEVRSTKNLSGGESFIVSLALALGLSKMASRKVRVDSLFLDEGFGTLDEDALETALDALAGLQQDGKIIGIISHVQALKERIGTQICVSSAGSDGKSNVKGPGVKNI